MTYQKIILDNWQDVPRIRGIERWLWLRCDTGPAPRHAPNLDKYLMQLRSPTDFPQESLPAMINHEQPGYPYEHRANLAASLAMTQVERPGLQNVHYATFNAVSEHLHRKTPQEYADWIEQQWTFHDFYRTQRAIFIPSGYDQMYLSTDNGGVQWVQNMIDCNQYGIEISWQAERMIEPKLPLGSIKTYAVWQIVRERRPYDLNTGEYIPGSHLLLPPEHRSMIFKAVRDAKVKLSNRWRKLDGIVTFGMDTMKIKANRFDHPSTEVFWKEAIEACMKPGETPVQAVDRELTEIMEHMVGELG